MRARLGLVILAVAGLLLIGVVVFVVARGRPTPPEDWERERGVPVVREPGEEPAEAESAIRVSGTELTVMEKGKVVWRAHFGGQIELDARGRTARAEEVDWRFQGAGFRGLRVYAPLMVADYDMQVLRFSEGIVIEAEERDLRFSAAQVVYEFGTRKLIATGDVRFRRGPYAGQARELVIDNRAKVIRLKSGQLVRTQ
ncbi:MAG: hypothetical protein AB7Y46_08465 [Armatimonadota bacterium]